MTSANQPSVAVVGAGVAGASAVRELIDRNVTVECFEKSRGSGGRASTRRVELESGRTAHFDHGAQYFTVRNDQFARFVKNGQRTDSIDRWNPRLGVREDGDIHPKQDENTRYVARPGMSSLADELLGEFKPRYSTRVQSLESADAGQRLVTEQGSAHVFDAVIVTAPPAQSADLVRSISPELTEVCESTTLQPTWAVLVNVPIQQNVKWDALFVNDGPLNWVAHNSSKPGRPDSGSWVLHASHEWSRTNVEESPEEVTETLLEEWQSILEVNNRAKPTYQSAHRWLYAKAEDPDNEGTVIDEENNIALAGDWLSNNRIEGGFLSGREAAHQIMKVL